MTDDKVKAHRQDVLDWIDNGMPAGALNFSETLRDSIKAIANNDALQAERDKLSAEVARLKLVAQNRERAEERHRTEKKAAEASLSALAGALERISRLKNSVGLGPARAIAEKALASLHPQPEPIQPNGEG